MIFLSAFACAAFLWVIRPDLAGPIQHVLHNVTITKMPKATIGSLSSEIVAWSQGPLGDMIAVAALLSGVAMGVMKQSAGAMLMGVFMAVTLHFGPVVMGSVMAGAQGQGMILNGQGVVSRGGGETPSGTRVTKLAYAPALIAATKLDVESRHHPLDAAQIHALQKDVTWIAGHTTALRVRKGKADAYSQSALDKLVYRLSLPLHATLRPGAAQVYSQHVQKTRAKMYEGMMVSAEFGMLLAVLVMALYLIRRNGKANLIEVDNVLDGLPQPQNS